MITLKDVLDLVGPLDDSNGENPGRERFRRHLAERVSTLGVVRDYIETCLRCSGPQYDRALQDLVNHTARLIGFEIEFGRYRGVTNDIGFDGIWRAENLAIVAEVKTTDAYAIKTATLLGYIDNLVSERRVDRDHTMGLYIVGRLDGRLKQLEDSIIADKVADRLRIASVESILSIAELVQDEHLTREEAIGLLRPAPPTVDGFIGVLKRVAAETVPPVADPPPPPPVPVPVVGEAPPKPLPDAPLATLHLLTPVAAEGETSAEATIRRLLDSGWYVFGDRTPGRKRLRPGDKLCFYQSGKGVVAQCEVASTPERKAIEAVQDSESYPWSFQVRKVRYFFGEPVLIDADLRAKLDAFKGRDTNKPWAWIVQATREVSAHDFGLLVGADHQ